MAREMVKDSSLKRNEINYPYLEHIDRTPREKVEHTQSQRMDPMPLDSMPTALLPNFCSNRTPINSIF